MDFNVLSQNQIQHSLKTFSPLDAAGSVTGKYSGLSGSTVTIALGTGIHEYLLAKFDGRNFGNELWYIGGLSGTITIPTGAGSTGGNQYSSSGNSLFTPGTTNVPDGGSTALLLGVVLLVAGLIRRKRS